MISRRIDIAPGNDNYGALAAYIADAAHKGEKVLTHWCAGCFGDDDYQRAIAGVKDIQAQNTRTAQAKTYHLMISFRPEDEGKLTPEVFRVMEERFAAALGLSEHQRHCGVHQNTGNLHMHIAYNLIHPERLTMHQPFRDFILRDKVCRELEREYGLAVDNGLEQAAPKQERLCEKASLVEAHTGQQSFEGYARERHSEILQALGAAKSWQDTHYALAIHGLEIKPHGNGLVIKDRHGKQAIKASALDRNLSQKKLEARFGPYFTSQDLSHVQERSRYRAEPLQRSPERGKLFAEYMHGIEERKNRLEHGKQQEDAALAAIRAEWAAKRNEIERMNIAKRNRRNLLQLARKHEAEALAKARLAAQPEREAVRRDIPFTSWNGFLQHKAEHGNEVALAVLRSIKEAADLEHVVPDTPGKNWAQHGREQFADQNAHKASQAAQERAVLESEALSGKGKTRLLAVLRMEQLAEEERRKSHVEGSTPLAIFGFRHTVDRKGTVIFTLPGGGRIMDAGRELFFSSQDLIVQKVAMQYAEKKWGKAIILEGNKICRKLGRDTALEQTRKQNRGAAG